LLQADDATKAGKPRLNPAALLILSVVAVCIYTCDQVSKYLVTQNLPLGESVPFIGELLQFHFVKNPGAAFSLGSGTTWIFAVIASSVVVFIILFARRIRSVGWAVVFGMLLGGTLGNLTDRLTRSPGFGRGHVVDFLQLYGFPAIFNVADIAIVSSMGLFIILTINGVGLDGTRAKRQTSSTGNGETDEPAAADPG
jgi:signal peptidase II